MARSEANIRIRCGVRIFLECNKGKYYTGKQLAQFLQDKLGMNGAAVDAGQIARLVTIDKSNMNGVLNPVDVQMENNRKKYAIL